MGRWIGGVVERVVSVEDDGLAVLGKLDGV